MRRALGAAALAVAAVIGVQVTAAASWDWCDFDPTVSLQHTGGKVVTVHATLFAPAAAAGPVAGTSIVYQDAAAFYATGVHSNGYSAGGAGKVTVLSPDQISNKVAPALHQIELNLSQGKPLQPEHLHPDGAMPNRYVFTFNVMTGSALSPFPVFAVISTGPDGTGDILASQPGWSGSPVFVELHI